jgi:hypothetical protein
MDLFCVIATKVEGRYFAERFFPPTNCVAESGDRLYHFYKTSYIGAKPPEQTLSGPDGHVIIKLRVFPTLDAAETWAELDASSRW